MYALVARARNLIWIFIIHIGDDFTVDRKMDFCGTVQFIVIILYIVTFLNLID